MTSTRVAFANVKVTLEHLAAAHALNEVLAYNPDLGGLAEWPKGRDDLVKAATAYDYARNDAGGGPVFWRRDRYSLVRCRALVLARRQFVGHLIGRKSALPASVATLAILCDDEDGSETAVINPHLTAEVQIGGRYRTDKAHRSRVRRHKKEVRRVDRYARRQKRRHRTVYVTTDSNYAGLELDSLVSCWEGQPNVGTVQGPKGNWSDRAIDIVFAPTHSKRVRTVITGSDHRAIVVDY